MVDPRQASPPQRVGADSCQANQPYKDAEHTEESYGSNNTYLNIWQHKMVEVNDVAPTAMNLP